MTCAYRVQNSQNRHTKPQPDSLSGESFCDIVVRDYPLGEADDFTPA